MIIKNQILFIIILLFQNFTVFGYSPEIDSLIQQIELTVDNNSKCDLFNDIALKYIDSDPAEAIFYAKKAFGLSTHLHYEDGLASSCLIQGNANEILNKYEMAMENFHSSLIIQKHLKNENEIAEIYFRLGRICKTTGNYEKAIEYCFNALRIREKNEDHLNISDIYNTIGSIYKYLGDYDQAFDYYFKCMDIQKEYREDGISAGIFNNIGIVYEFKEEHDEALRYYEHSLEIRLNNNDSLGIASSFNNIAVILLDQEKFDSAIYYLRKSQAIKEKYGDQKSLFNVYYNISQYYYKCKDYSKAIEYANMAQSIAQNLKLSLSSRAIHELLKDIYQALGQFEKALEHQIKYTLLNDSIFNTEKSIRINQLATLYESELNQAKYDLKDQRKKFINIAIFSVLFFLLVILFFAYKNSKSKLKQDKLKRSNLEMEKEKLNLKLEIKNRELARNIIHLTEKNELLLGLKTTLQKLKSNIKDENISLIESGINDIKASSNNKIWNEFEFQFINVHKNFYDVLCSEHPGLTQNEKRLAAFLKLNMASKEISMITKQSAHSITVARTRLRKKLGLSNTDINLCSFLSKY